MGCLPVVFRSAANRISILSNLGFRSKLADAFDAQHEVFMVLKSFPLVSTVLFHLPPWLLMKVFPDGGRYYPIVSYS